MRLPDQHLSADEIEELGKEEGLSGELGDQLRPAREHAESCPACRRRLEVYPTSGAKLEKLRAPEGSQKGPNCPSIEIWLQVAGGLLTNSEEKRYIAHAAQCDCCGLVLRKIVEDFSDQLREGEKIALSRLGNGYEEWQHLRANHVTSTQQDSLVVSKSRRWFGLRTWQAAATVTACLAITIFFVIRQEVFKTKDYTIADVDGLLVKAYSERRTIVLRFPGAGYAPLSVERGTGIAHQQLPGSLLEAEVVIARKSSNGSEDGEFLRVKAGAALLEWDYANAIKELDEALTLRPNDPALLVNRATALFERAQNTRNSASLDYGEAAQELSRVLSVHPDDPIALFNRAIIYEKLSLYNEAITDWEHYLQIDPQGAWAEEAREMLDRLKEKVAAHTSALSKPLLEPSNFVALMREPLGVPDLDRRIEEYQDIAIRKWLPQAFSPQTEPKTRKVALVALRCLSAVLLVEHNDNWLRDLLDRSSPSMISALLSLKDAVERTAAGDPAGADASATNAAQLFRKMGNGAGALRATLEHIHALQRSQRGDLCLQVSKQIGSELAHTSYHWLQTQLEIEQCGCSMKLGNFEAARLHIMSAKADGSRFAYPTLQLRSAGIGASLEIDEGDVPAGWAANQEGLEQYWRNNFAPPIRAQQFYDSSTYAAEDLGYKYLARASAAEAVRAAAASGFRSIEALNRSHLGKLEMQLGLLDSAELELAHASVLLLSLPRTEATQTYRIDAEIDLAELEIARGDFKAAYVRLESIEPSLKRVTNFTLPLRLYHAYATALVRQNRWDEAENVFQKAIGIATSNLVRLSTLASRYFWMAEVSDLFRDLVQFEMSKGNAERALTIWEWYRSAALGPSTPPFPATKQFYDRLRTLGERAVLSYAVLPQGLAAWLFDSTGVRSHFLRIDNSDLLRYAQRFARHCADPAFDLTLLKQQARHLYQLFIAPFGEHLRENEILVIERDEALADLPIQALLGPNDTYLSESHPLLFSVGIIFSNALKPVPAITPRSKILVVASNTTLKSGQEIDPALDVDNEAADIISYFHHSRLLAQQSSSYENLERFLPDADVFHFAGHAIATTRDEGLILLGRGGPQGQLPFVWNASRVSSKLFKKCKLVVLAACSTGTGDVGRRETHSHLVRAMVSAGVPYVVASQWDVNSAATTRYMSIFYANLVQSGDISIATREASGALRNRYRMPHPFYWAPFITFSSN